MSFLSMLSIFQPSDSIPSQNFFVPKHVRILHLIYWKIVILTNLVIHQGHQSYQGHQGHQGHQSHRIFHMYM